MIKIINNNSTDNEIPMKEMKPLQVAEIVDTQSIYRGTIVLRTDSTSQPSFIDLTKPGPDRGWTGNAGIIVKLLDKPITIEISND